jgi:hypothetical protein
MKRAFRLLRCGVSVRVLGIASLAAILFMTGCTTSGSGEAQLAVATLSGGLPAGSVSVGGGVYPATALKASGGTGPYTWAVTTGTLPAGLTLSSSGMISGSPTVAGTSTFTVTVTDSATPTAHTASGSLSITINPQLAISTTGTLTNIGEAGAVYPTTALTQTGGVGPFNWVLNSGSLPGGLTLSSTGSVTGTISASAVPGTFNFTAKVTDSQGNLVTSGTLSITVNAALVVTPPSLSVGLVGIPYTSTTLAATGGVPPYTTWTLTGGTSLPAGLALSTAGVISGTPTGPAGTTNFTVQVKDTANYTATANLSITINAALAITTTSASLPTGAVASIYPSTTLAATGGVPPYTSWTLMGGTTLPNGLSLSAAGVITGTPTAAGTTNFTVQVSDSLSNHATANLSITVNAALAVTTTSASLPFGVVASLYPPTTLAATGGVPPYTTWSLAGGTTLPRGLSLSAAGVITGTPTGPVGPTVITVQVKDTGNYTATANLVITIVSALAVTPASLPTGLVATPYTSTTLAATGGIPPYTTWTLTGGTALPAGLTLSTAGVISGTPTGPAGTTNFTVQVKDTQNDTATANLSITVNAALAVTTSSLPTGVISSPYPAGASTTFAAVGGITPYTNWAVTVGSLPAGLNLNPATGAITGTPTGPATTSNFTVRVTDSASNTATKALSITVNAALTVTTSSLPAADVNSAYPSGASTTLAAVGGVPPYTNWAVTVGSLPVGLNLNVATGAITGTPTGTPGTSNFTVQVTDTGGFTSTRALSITVNAALTITTTSLPTGVVNALYPSTTLAAAGGTTPYTNWAVIVGSLPAGLNLNVATGAITGTPTGTPGTSNFTVQVTDSGSYTAAKALSITVDAALGVTTSSLPTGAVNSLYPSGASATLAATGGIMPYTNWAVTLGGLPAGLNLNPATGAITGTPTGPATTSNFTVQVTDSASDTATRALSITVNAALAIVTSVLSPADLNSAYTFGQTTLAASGGVPPYTNWAVTVGSLPVGLTLNAATGAITGTPTGTPGTANFTAQVTDSGNYTATKALSITVNSAILITPPTFPTGVVNNVFNVGPYSATGGQLPYTNWVVSTGSLPAGLLLNTVTGQVSGTPTTSGTFTFKVSVQDALGYAGTSAQSTITVNPALSISTTSLPGVLQGAQYNQTLQAAGGIGPYSNWMVTVGSLPTGLTLAPATGIITGSTTVALGNYPFTVQVTDSIVDTATQPLSITVTTFAITTTSLPTGVVNTAYPSTTLTLTGGTGPFTWTITSGNVPGLSLAPSTGVISGTPTSTGSFPITVRVQDSASHTATANLSITVNGAPVFTSASSTSFAAGTAGSFMVTATGFPIPALAETGTRPIGVTFTDNGNGTGTLSWTAAVASGSYSLTFTASNSVLPNATQNFTLTANAAPVITSAGSTSFIAGTAGSFMVTATGFPIPALSETASLPTGVSFHDNGNSTGTLSWTAAVASGSYALSFTASNNVLPNGTQNFTLTVNAAPVFTSANSAGFTAGTAGSFMVSVSGFPIPSLSETAALPTGVTFHDNGNSTGTLSWTAAVTSGSYSLSFTASNSVLPNATQSFTLTAGTAPAFTSLNSTTSTAGTAGSFTVSTTGFPIPSISETTALPTGITFHDNGNGTGTLSWTAAVAGGSYGLSFTASNGVLPNATQGFTLTLDSAPVFTSANSTSFTAGSAGSFTITTNGFPIPAITETLTLPSGVTFHDNGDSTGTLSWTSAVASGVYNLSFTASNTVLPNATQSFTLTATPPSCTNNCTLSGTVSDNSQGLAGLTVTITGPSPATTVTNAVTAANGGYSFSGLTAGQYSVSFSPGYTTIPATPLTLTINSNTVQNFTATPTFASSSITGTVTYSGTQTVRRTFIRVSSGGCNGGCNTVAGTSITLTQNGNTYTGSYTVRGLLPVGSNNNGNGTYIVSAQIDTTNNGQPNASNPQQNSGLVMVNAPNVTVPLITMVDPSTTPQTPTGLTVIMEAQGAVAGGLVMYNAPQSNGEELGTSYKLYLGTDTNASNLTPITIQAHGTHDSVYILSGLSAGVPYYFKISSLVGTTESPVSSVVGPLTPTAGTGANTVSAMVTFQGTATGPLYVGVIDQSKTPNVAYGTRIATPVSGTTYSVTGVPSGTYQVYAIIDNNQNGVIDVGDFNDVTSQSGTPTVTLNGGTTPVTIALNNATTTPYIATDHQASNGNGDNYWLNLGLNWGTLRPVAATLISGPNVTVPWDLPVDENNSVQTPGGSTIPQVGDTYTFQVTLFNPATQAITTQTLMYSLPAIPGQSPSAAVINSFAQNLTMITSGSEVPTPTPTVPYLSWAAPSPAVSFPYTYQVGLSGNNNGVNWYYSGGKHSNGIPSSQTSVQFNTDGSATQNGSPISSLPGGGSTFYWQVTVQDANGDQAQSASATYMTPGGAAPPTVSVSFTSSSIPIGGITTLNFNIANPNGSTPLNGIAFTDNLPGNLQLLGTVAFNTCSGSINNVTSGSNSLNLSGASLGGGATCTFGVNVTDAVAETVNNTTTAITSSNSAAGTTSNTASLTVAGTGPVPPVVTVSFAASSIPAGATTTLTFNIYNNNGSTTLTGIAFTDNLPGHLQMTGAVAFNNCSGTVNNVASGSTSLNLSGASLGAGANCTFGVTVTDAVGETANDTTTAITSNEGGTGSTSNTASLIVTPPVTAVATSVPFPVFAGGAAVNIAITVSNDRAGDALTASLTVDSNTGLACTLATCGSLVGSVTGTSGSGTYSVSYMPPASTAGFTQTVPTIVVSSSLSGSFADTDYIEVDPSGVPFVTLSGLGGGGITQPNSGPRTVTATVYNDGAGNPGVTFAPITGGGYACANFGVNSCGTLGTPSAPTVVSGATVTTVTYTPPTSTTPPSPPYDRPRLQATSVASPTQLASRQFLLSNNPASTTGLTIPVNQKFYAALSGGAPITVNADIGNDTGNIRTVTWTLTYQQSQGGSFVTCPQPTCGTLSAAIPTGNGTSVSSQITYTPPSAVPTGTGEATPTITATSVDNPSATDSFTFTIVDGTCAATNNGVLNGHYAFLLRGSNAGNGYTALIGSFTTNGAGGITGGLLDVNTSVGPTIGSTILSSGSSYTVGPDNRVCLTLANSGGGVQTFRASLGTIVAGVATEGRIVRFDDNTGRGPRQSGVLMKQDTTSFNAGSINGPYAFGIVGVDSTGGRNAGAGVFTANGSGTMSGLTEDFDSVGGATGVLTGSGASTMTATGRGTATVTINVTGGTSTSHSVLYMVSPSEILLMTTDALGSNTPILSGEVKKQTGPFPTTTLDGSSYIFYTTGLSNSDGTNESTVGHFVFAVGANGVGNGLIDDNGNPENSVMGTFMVASNGRVTIPAGGTHPPILYLVNSSLAFVVDTSSSVASGWFEQQTGGPFSTASISGQYFFGAEAPTTGSGYASGTATFTPATGVIAGTEDGSGGNLKSNSPISNGGTPITYCFATSVCTPATTAAGQGNVGGSLAYIISPSKVIFMDSNGQNGQNNGTVNRNFVLIQK